MNSDTWFYSLTDLNQLINHLNNARSWKQTVDHLLSWLKTYCQCSAGAYIQVRPGSQNQISWIRSNPRGSWIHSSIAAEITAFIPSLSEENKPFLQLNTQNAQLSPSLRDWFIHQNFESLTIFPILSNKDIIGLCLLGFRTSAKQDLFSHPLVIQTLSLFFSNFVYLQSTIHQAEAKIKEMDQFIHAGLELTASLNLEETLNTILENALSLTPKANDAHIFLYENEELYFGAALHQNGSSGSVWANPRKDGLTYTVARQGKMILIPDMTADPLFKNAPKEWKGTIIGIPLLNQKTVVGVMTAAKLIPNSFTDKEITNLEHLADQAANVIRNIRTYDRISMQAYTDPLTNLPNRRAFEGESVKLLDSYGRQKRQFCIAMLDLNGFKRINDIYGHTAGDQALRVIANCIKQAIRKTDLLARYGGDEFIVLLPETDMESARMVMEKLITTISECEIQLTGTNTERLSISYGLAAFPHMSLNIDELIETADKELYRHKEHQKK